MFMIVKARIGKGILRMIPRRPGPDGVPERPEIPQPISGSERIPPQSQDIWEELEKLKKRVEVLEKSQKELTERTSKLEEYHKS